MRSNGSPSRERGLTYEEQIDHYKGDSYFTMAPSAYIFQEADGTKVAPLFSYQNSYAYGYSGSTGKFTPSGVCSGSITQSSTILSANPSGGAPIIDPACYVISSYFRSQPTREIFPSEILRLQSSSIKNVTMNGNVRYTNANMNMPHYYEDFQGPAGSESLDLLCRLCERQAGNYRSRLRHRLAGDEEVQSGRADRLLECAPAGSRRANERDHYDGAHDCRQRHHQQYERDELHDDKLDHNLAGRLQADHLGA